METDTSMWLCNKLDSIDNQWSSGGIATHFSNTILHNIYDCFLQLETKLKIKLLLTFLKIPLRNMEGLQVCVNSDEVWTDIFWKRTGTILCFSI